jgi:hypothetical protein
MANMPGTNDWMNPDWMKWGGIGSGLGPAAGGLMGLFGGGNKNPADAGMSYLNQIPGALQPYYQPWINGGQNAMNQTQGVYGQMTQDPNAYYDKIASGYKQSPGYQARLQAGLQATGNAAAAGGMAGSNQHQFEAAEKANDIQGQDFQNYLNQVLGINNTGLQGNENALNRGYNASTGYGNALGTNLAQQGGLAFQGQAGENSKNQSGWENLFSGAGAALPWLFF